MQVPTSKLPASCPLWSFLELFPCSDGSHPILLRVGTTWRQAGKMSRVLSHIMPEFPEGFQKKKVEKLTVCSVTDLCSLDP